MVIVEAAASKKFESAYRKWVLGDFPLREQHHLGILRFVFSYTANM